MYLIHHTFYWKSSHKWKNKWNVYYDPNKFYEYQIIVMKIFPQNLKLDVKWLFFDQVLNWSVLNRNLHHSTRSFHSNILVHFRLKSQP